MSKPGGKGKEENIISSLVPPPPSCSASHYLWGSCLLSGSLPLVHKALEGNRCHRTRG